MATRDTTDFIILHCAASKPSQDWGVKEIDRMHRARGFFKIGYHIVIRRDGTIEYGRALDQKGAHCKDGGMNHISVGVCLVGGVSEHPQKHIPGNPWNGSDAEDNFTDAQWEALSVVLKGLRVDYPTAKVIGHRDVPGVRKDCPSFDVASKLDELGLAD